MILNRNFYNKIPSWKSWWFRRQLLKLTGDKIFKSFKLHKTEWPQKLYFYSPRLKRKPMFIGSAEKLSLWKESKMCENICPTQAIKVKAEAIIIDDRGCIGCGLCVEFAPAGILEMLREVTP
jgi:ferredoxin-like protein FixX